MRGVEEIGRRKLTQLTDAVLALCQNEPNDEVRVAAITALKALGSEVDQDTLNALLMHKSSRLRKAAIEEISRRHLSWFGTAVRALGLNDTDAEVRLAAQVTAAKLLGK